MDGLSTIRAFDAEKRLSDEFYRHQDLYSSAILTMKVSQAAFNFFMGVLSASFTSLIIAKYLFFEEGKQYFLFYKVTRSRFKIRHTVTSVGLDYIHKI